MNGVSGSVPWDGAKLLFRFEQAIPAKPTPRSQQAYTLLQVCWDASIPRAQIADVSWQLAGRLDLGHRWAPRKVIADAPFHSPAREYECLSLVEMNPAWYLRPLNLSNDVEPQDSSPAQAYGAVSRCCGAGCALGEAGTQ